MNTFGLHPSRNRFTPQTNCDFGAIDLGARGCASSESECEKIEADAEDVKVNEVPLNFQVVDESGGAKVFRSGFPKRCHLDFVDTLHLKTVIALSTKPIPEEVSSHYKSRGISLLFANFAKGNKYPFHSIDREECVRALRVLCDTRHHPVLVHCKRGKHRTGSLVGLYRRLKCDWSLSRVFAEYVLIWI